MVVKKNGTGEITEFLFHDLVGSNTLTIENGGIYTLSELPSAFNIEALTSGNVGSVKFEN